MVANGAERNSQSEPARRGSLSIEIRSASSEVTIDASGSGLTSSVWERVAGSRIKRTARSAAAAAAAAPANHAVLLNCTAVPPGKLPAAPLANADPDDAGGSCSEGRCFHLPVRCCKADAELTRTAKTTYSTAGNAASCAGDAPRSDCVERTDNATKLAKCASGIILRRLFPRMRRRSRAPSFHSRLAAWVWRGSCHRFRLRD
jgi:hypothetical protein